MTSLRHRIQLAVDLDVDPAHEEGRYAASSRWHVRARADYKRCGFSCGRDDLAPRAHRRGAEHTV